MSVVAVMAFSDDANAAFDTPISTVGGTVGHGNIKDPTVCRFAWNTIVVGRFETTFFVRLSVPDLWQRQQALR